MYKLKNYLLNYHNLSLIFVCILLKYFVFICLLFKVFIIYKIKMELSNKFSLFLDFLRLSFLFLPKNNLREDVQKKNLSFALNLLYYFLSLNLYFTGGKT